MCSSWNTLVKVLEQMSMINFMNYFLSTAAEGFVPSHAPLKNNKHLNIPFQSTQLRRGKDKSELQGLTPSSWDPCLRNEERGLGNHASILSVMPAGQPKTGGSWWRGLTECGPLEEGMANHFSSLALRTP